MIMEFIWFQKCLTDERFQPSAYLVDIHNEQEAIRETEKIANSAYPCTVVCLFALEGNEIVCAVRGWKKDQSGMLKDLLPKDIESIFHVTKDTFDQKRPKPGDLKAWRKLRQ